jgi:LPXTG-motif cell wall-anchored protein
VLGNPLGSHTGTSSRRRRPGRAGAVLALVVALGALAFVAAPATAKSKAKTTTPALANLKIQAAAVTIKASGKSKFVAAKDGQALRQGDSLKTDAAGKAEIDYTDGSLTRLGSSTEFTITKLTNQRGGRQTEGTLTVGETWSRASKVSETSSFEVKAGGTTAAVEGTAFAFNCTLVNGQLSCTVIAVVNNTLVTTANGGQTDLPPATKVNSIGGNLGPVVNLTFDDLNGNVQISGNLVLDQQAGKGKGLDDLPPPPTPTTTPPTTTTTKPGGGVNAAANPTVTQQDVPAVGPSEYPPNGGITVDDPTISAGGTEVFRGTGCGPNEVLTVLFDGKVIGTITANAQGAFAGSITIPRDTPQGTHTLTVRGSTCELNATITVSGTLAFTGASSHTNTYVLLGIAAIVLGLVLVVGARRRRHGRALAARASP